MPDQTAEFIRVKRRSTTSSINVTTNDEAGLVESEEIGTTENLTEEEVLEMLADKHRFQDVGKIVHIGIIDFLTSYTCAKKVEKTVK